MRCALMYSTAGDEAVRPERVRPRVQALVFDTGAARQVVEGGGGFGAQHEREI